MRKGSAAGQLGMEWIERMLLVVGNIRAYLVSLRGDFHHDKHTTRYSSAGPVLCSAGF